MNKHSVLPIHLAWLPLRPLLPVSLHLVRHLPVPHPLVRHHVALLVHRHAAVLHAVPESKMRNPVRIRIRDINRISNLVRILIFHGYQMFPELYEN